MTAPLTWNLHGNDQLSAVLERLDRTVSKLDRTMASGAAQAHQYGGAMGSAENSAKRFSGQVQTTSGHVEGLNGKIAAAAATLRTMAVTAAVAFGAAAVAAGGYGLKMAAANEDAAISFELMLGSAKKAKDFLAQLQQFAAATPFEMPQLRDAASRLLAVGVDANRIIPILTTLGDATAGMGTGAMGIERAVTALTQMQQKTKVTGEEMLQLTEAGIPAWEALAAKLNVDVATAMKKVTNREVDAGVIFDAVQERTGKGLQRLSGMMEKQSTTLNGVWSTFKDNAGQALAKFVEPALPALKKLVLATGDAIPKVMDKFKAMGNQLADVFKGSPVPQQIIDSLKALGEKILPVLKHAWDGLVGTIRDNKEGLEKLGRFIATTVVPFLGDTLVATIGVVSGAFEAIIIVLGHVMDAIEVLVMGFLHGSQKILNAAVWAFGWIPGLGDKLKDAKIHFDEFVVGVQTEFDKLDGMGVDMYINTHERGAKGEHGGSGVGSGSTATASSAANSGIVKTTITAGPGGKIPAYDSGGMVGGPYGSPQLILAHGGERVLTAAQQRSSGGDIIGVLRVVHETPDGRVIREELLSLKRNAGLSSLGF